MIVAVIPARGGSKGVLRKNLRTVGGKPMLAWSIEAALAARRLDGVYVSTEDAEIADVARHHGAKVIDRPAELATDTARAMDALKHAITQTSPDILVVLQPTSPVREPGLVDRCIARFLETGADNLATGYMCQIFEYGSYTANRQDLGAFFHDDGSVYVVRAELVMQAASTDGIKLGKKTEVVLTSREQHFEIDDEFDLWLNDKILSEAGAPWLRRPEVRLPTERR